MNERRDVLTGLPLRHTNTHGIHPYRSCACGHRHDQHSVMVNGKTKGDDTSPEPNCRSCDCSSFVKVSA